MSINPLSIGRQVLPEGNQKCQTRSARTGGKSFSETLGDLEMPASPAALERMTVITRVELAQLRLLQGLFASEKENNVEDDLFAPLNRPVTADHGQPSGQIIDRLYVGIKPHTLTPEPDDQDEIHRMIDRVAEQVHLAPELIRSVVAAESAFQSDAVSPAGARGLMQLMPETAKEMGVQDSFDPQQNLFGGSQYLKQLLDKYGGDLDRALAAYNWGQGNVDRKGMAQMPQETRNYLDRVKTGLVRTEA